MIFVGDSFVELLGLIYSTIDMLDHDIVSQSIPYWERDDIEELSYRKWGAKELANYILANMDTTKYPCEMVEEFLCKFIEEEKNNKNEFVEKMFHFACSEICEIYDMYIYESD